MGRLEANGYVGVGHYRTDNGRPQQKKCSYDYGFMGDCQGTAVKCMKSPYGFVMTYYCTGHYNEVSEMFADSGVVLHDVPEYLELLEWQNRKGA